MSSIEMDVAVKKEARMSPLIITFGIIAISTAIVWIYHAELNELGKYLIVTYGRDQIDILLLFITAISCTPLVLPVWGYALVGVGLGYSIYRLAIIMAIGSAVGSFVTYLIGKYFSKRKWVKKKFPNLNKHPWTHGRSKKYVTWILFVGTASPIPCDVLYAVCGTKKFPPAVFFTSIVLGRLVRYTYLGLIFKYVVT